MTLKVKRCKFKISVQEVEQREARINELQKLYSEAAAMQAQYELIRERSDSAREETEKRNKSPINNQN